MSSSTRRKVFFQLFLVMVLFLLFFFTWQLLGFIPTPLGFQDLVIISFVFFIASLLSLFAIRSSIHSRILGPVRRFALYHLSPIAIKQLQIEVKVLLNGDAVVNYRVHGIVNFGLVRWYLFDISTDSQQPTHKDFKFRATDLRKNRALYPEVMLNEPRYKRIKINFGRVLERGDEFEYEINYTVRRTFYFDKMDYYIHRAKHSEKEVILSVLFPEEMIVDLVYGETTNDFGDVRRSHITPKIVKPNLVRWKIQHAVQGSSYILRWKVSKKH